MSGTFGVAPNYSRMSLCPCVELKHSVMPTQRGLADMVKAINTWAAAPVQAVAPAPRTLVTYSASTQAATGWIRDNVDDPETREVRVVALGSSETPGNGWTGVGHKRESGLPTGEGAVYDNVEFVVVQYDPVADKATNPNFWSRINEKMSTHTRGYDDIDLDDPDAVWTDPVTGSTTKYYRSDTLPMLRWRERFTSEERMAELDARYRPRIEKAYDRPVDLESPDDGDDQGQGAESSSGSQVQAASGDQDDSENDTEANE